MTFSLQQLQEEQVPWVKHNFGDRAAYQPLLGMTEELGEFCYAVGMMRTQGRAFEKELVDAHADILIYMCDFATGIDVRMADIEDVLPEEHDEEAGTFALSEVSLCLAEYLGEVSHHYLKREQGIRGSASEHHDGMVAGLKKMISSLKLVAEMFDWPFLEKVESIWAQVKKRDWKKDPKHADQNV